MDESFLPYADARAAMSASRRVHCWTDKHAWVVDQVGWGSEAHLAVIDEPSATCMLWEGHPGAHEWTPDDQIGVTFP